MFSLTAILILGLGIGGTTAMFTIVNAVLVQPLPYKEPDRLVTLEQTVSGGRGGVPAADVEEWRARNQAFEDMTAYTRTQITLIGTDEPQRIAAARVLPNFFSVLGAAPAVGRAIPSGDEASEGVAVVSHGFWQRELGGTPDAIGKRLIFHEGGLTVIGVMPREFHFRPAETQLWVPGH